MSKPIPQTSPLPWSVTWHTTPCDGGGDFTISDAEGHAIFFEGLGCAPGDPELLCEAVNNYGWMKEKLAMLGIEHPDNASESRS